MYQDVKNSIIASFYERLTSPLLGTFFIFWIVSNWRPISIYFFSEKEIEERIDVLVKDWSGLNNLIFEPALLTVLFLIVYPFLSVATYWVWEKMTVSKNNIKFKLGLDTSLSVRDAQVLRKRIKSLDEEIASEIKNSNELKQNLTNRVNGLQFQLRECEKKLLKYEESDIADYTIKSIRSADHQTQILDALERVIESFITSYRKGRMDDFSLRNMVGPQIWEEIPRMDRPVVDKQFKSRVEGSVYPELRFVSEINGENFYNWTEH